MNVRRTLIFCLAGPTVVIHCSLFTKNSNLTNAAKAADLLLHEPQLDHEDYADQRNSPEMLPVKAAQANNQS